MKLFVVGSDSSNPKDWSIWDEVCIVIAEDGKRAIDLVESGHGVATEIKLNKEQVLIRGTEPNWGDDI